MHALCVDNLWPTHLLFSAKKKTKEKKRLGPKAPGSYNN